MINNFIKNKKSRTSFNSSFKLLSIIESNNIDFGKEIEVEKRKRNQAYLALDYFISRVTYFDFFSVDAFKIAKYSKYFVEYFNLKIVTPEILLISCFYCNSNLSKFLKPYEVENNLEKNLLKLIITNEKETKLNNKNFLNNINSLYSTSEFKNNNIEYSRQVNQIFLKASEFSLSRFKSPVITSEIIFLTLMEEKSFSTSKIIKKILGNDTDWYLLRYQLIKHLHSQESNIRSEVSKNQQYFAYLLKTQLGETEFDKLLETQGLNDGVSIFRNMLISESIKLDLFKRLLNDIKKSIKITNTRKYSS